MRTKATEPTIAKPPQPKPTPEERLLELEHLAIDWLEKAVKGDNVPPKVALAAAIDVLDRAGHKAPDKVEVTFSEDAALLAEVFTPEEWEDIRCRILDYTLSKERRKKLHLL
jgi:hypothetical protein